MRLNSLFIIMTLIIAACSSDGSQLPTQLALPSVATTTLIPTQLQQLTTPTLPDTIPDVSSQTADSQSSDTVLPTDTPNDCTVQDDWEIYVIQRGDNLVTIASRTGSTVDELTAANCLENPNRVRAGQELYVPNLPETATQRPTSTTTATPIQPTASSIPTTATSRPTSTIAPTASSTPQPSPEASTLNISTIPATNKKTFKSEFGFGIDFPADWFVTDSTTSTVENVFITSFEYTLGDEIPQNRWTDEMVSVTVTIFQETTQETLDDWSQSIMTQLQNATNITDAFAPVTLRTDGELEGRSIDYVTNDDTIVRNYYFIINQHKIQINIGGNFDLAVSVINSLQPVFD